MVESLSATPAIGNKGENKDRRCVLWRQACGQGRFYCADASSATEPLFSIEVVVLDDEKGDSNAPRDAVVPASQAGSHDFGAWLGLVEGPPFEQKVVVAMTST